MSDFETAIQRIDTALGRINPLARLLPINRAATEDSLLRLVLDTIPAMIWVKRVPDGFMLLCNQSGAEMGGTTRKKMENTFPEQWWPESFTKKWLIDDNEVAATGRPKVNFLERVIHPKSKQRRWVRTSKFPILDDSGEVSAVLVCAIDVTEIVPPEVRNQ